MGSYATEKFYGEINTQLVESVGDMVEQARRISKLSEKMQVITDIIKNKKVIVTLGNLTVEVPANKDNVKSIEDKFIEKITESVIDALDEILVELNMELRKSRREFDKNLEEFDKIYG